MKSAVSADVNKHMIGSFISRETTLVVSLMFWNLFNRKLSHGRRMCCDASDVNIVADQSSALRTSMPGGG